MRGYSQNLLARPGAKRRRSLYNLYLYLIWIVEHYYRQYDSDFILRLGHERAGLLLEEIAGW